MLELTGPAEDPTGPDATPLGCTVIVFVKVPVIIVVIWIIEVPELPVEKPPVELVKNGTDELPGGKPMPELDPVPVTPVPEV